MNWILALFAFVAGVAVGAFWGGWLMMSHYLRREGKTMLRVSGGDTLQREAEIEYELIKHSNAN